MSIEVAKQRVELVRERFAAAKHISELRAALKAMVSPVEQERLDNLSTMSVDERVTTLDTLRTEIPRLYVKLLSTPPNDRFKEVSPLFTPNNGVSYCRELDIIGLGRIDVTRTAVEGGPSFSIEVGDLPSDSGLHRAEESVLAKFEPWRADIEQDDLLGILDLYHHQDTLASICEAAGISPTE